VSDELEKEILESATPANEAPATTVEA